MPKVRLSRRADRDLEAILRRGLKEYAPATAVRYYNRILSGFAAIAERPRAAQEHPEYAAGIRFHFEGSHRIVYRIDAKGVIVIVRVLHARQETKRHI